MPRASAVCFSAAALLWVVILLSAPLALADGFSALPALIYQAASLVCHQRPERSFHLAGVQLPVCARCFGLYLSGAIGSVPACLFARPVGAWLSRRHALLLLGTASVPTLMTVAAEWAGLIQTTGLARAVAAVPLGAGAGWLLVGLLTAPAEVGVVPG